MTFYAFDLLYADGYDLRPAKLIDRKLALARIISKAPKNRFLFAEHVELDGAAVHRRGCEMGLEGIVSKLRDGPYRSGRIETWIKTLCRKRDTFPVVGFIAEQPRSIAALYLGRREGKDLLYAGKAGTGFTFESARMLRERLEPIAVRKFAAHQACTKAEGYLGPAERIGGRAVSLHHPRRELRHASFKGVRDDLAE